MPYRHAQGLRHQSWSSESCRVRPLPATVHLSRESQHHACLPASRLANELLHDQCPIACTLLSSRVSTGLGSCIGGVRGQTSSQERESQLHASGECLQEKT